MSSSFEMVVAFGVAAFAVASSAATSAPSFAVVERAFVASKGLVAGMVARTVSRNGFVVLASFVDDDILEKRPFVGSLPRFVQHDNDRVASVV